MTDTLISFETAKLAKEKGYDIQSTKFYKAVNPTMTKEDSRVSIQVSDFQTQYNFRSYADLYSAPTQSLLQKWLREVHKLHIVIDTTPSYDSIYPSKWKSTIYEPFTKLKWITGKYNIADTYEDSLEQALLEGLKLIK